MMVKFMKESLDFTQKHKVLPLFFYNQVHPESESEN